MADLREWPGFQFPNVVPLVASLLLAVVAAGAFVAAVFLDGQEIGMMKVEIAGSKDGSATGPETGRR